MKTSTKGFGLIEGLVVVVALGLLVLGGMWIMDKNADINSNSQQTTITKEPEQPVDTEQPTEQPEGIDTSRWTVFDGVAYTLKVPDGWNLQYNLHDSLGLFDLNDSLEYTPGTPATLSEVNLGRDGYFEVFILPTTNPVACTQFEELVDNNLSFGGNEAVRCSGDGTGTAMQQSSYEAYKISNPNGGSIEARFATMTQDGSVAIMTEERVELIYAMLGTIQFK